MQKVIIDLLSQAARQIGYSLAEKIKVRRRLKKEKFEKEVLKEVEKRLRSVGVVPGSDRKPK